MADTKKIKYEVFVCRQCGNKTSHKFLYTHSVPESLGIYDDDYNEINTYYYFFLFECSTCKGMSLKGVYSEEIDSGPRGGEVNFENINYIYPSLRLLSQVPKGLDVILAEANRVKNISSFAYLILVRKLLEEVCKDKNIKGNNLKTKLDNLVLKEKLPNIFSQASNKLRLLGNIGAHESKLNITKIDISLIEDFLLALLEYVYILPTKLQNLDKALTKQSKKINS